MRLRVKRGATLLAAAGVLLTSGCSLDGRGDLPWAKGVGSDSYQITVRMADVGNLVPNAEVKVNDVTVGTVTRIRMENWQAVLDVSLARSARLPENAIANVGQKSLLGAQYLQVAEPSGTEPSVTLLRQGGVIPIERTGTYPGTEELLIALSSFLNGSGLTQLKTIIGEMNKALDGRTEDIKALLTHLQQVSGQLSAQRETMAQLLERMNKLAGTLAKQSPQIERSLPALGPGLAALDKQRPALMRAMKSVDDLDAVATPVLETNRAGLTTEIAQLRPVLSRVADAGNDTVDALETAATVVYPINLIKNNVYGDYQNLFVNFDAHISKLEKTLTQPSSVYDEQNTGANAANTTQLLAPTTRGGSR
jgi:phospholipid/cholesterol/gamma-HCH transport system substrate-binding protein